MSPANPFSTFAFGQIFESVLPDFVLAFTFFTALVYAVLGKRFGQQRPAIAASAALGLALSVGLVWWEQSAGMSIRNLGPAAVGFAIVILAGVMYQSIRQTGGSWAGAGIALGGSLMVGWILGAPWPVREEIIQTVILVAMVGGILAFFAHQKGTFSSFPAAKAERADIRHDMSDLFQEKQVSRKLEDRFRNFRKQENRLTADPDTANTIMQQLQQMLPAEGYLTERLAALREKAHAMRQGHAHRIEQIQAAIKTLPPEAQQKAAAELADQYKEMRLDLRLERLDGAVAANERRIRDLTRQAEEYAAANDYPKLDKTLKEAATLQKHNTRLSKLIKNTESRIMAAASRIARNATEVSRG